MLYAVLLLYFFPRVRTALCQARAGHEIDAELVVGCRVLPTPVHRARWWSTMELAVPGKTSRSLRCAVAWA